MLADWLVSDICRKILYIGGVTWYLNTFCLKKETESSGVRECIDVNGISVMIVRDTSASKSVAHFMSYIFTHQKHVTSLL